MYASVNRVEFQQDCMEFATRTHTLETKNDAEASKNKRVLRDRVLSECDGKKVVM